MSGSASVGSICGALLICFVKSPWNPGWIGWKGGWSIRRRDLGPKKEEPAVDQALDEASAEEARPRSENQTAGVGRGDLIEEKGKVTEPVSHIQAS